MALCLRGFVPARHQPAWLSDPRGSLACVAKDPREEMCRQLCGAASDFALPTMPASHNLFVKPATYLGLYHAYIYIYICVCSY